MSGRKKSALRKVDASMSSLATKYLDPHPANVRHGVARFAEHLRTLKPLDLAKLGTDPERLGLIARDFFTNHAPHFGIEPKEEPKEERPNLARQQDASVPAFGLRTT